MSTYLAAIFVLGLPSFARAQELNAEKLDGLRFELLRCEQPLHELTATRTSAQESFSFNATPGFVVSFEFLMQDADADLKARILEKVRAKLSTDRAALLRRIEKIIDDELGKPAPVAKPDKPGPGPGPKAEPEGDAKVKDLERKMRLLEEQKETLAAEMAKAKRQAGDEALREEARKGGPHDAEEAQEMFDNALELHDKDKNYREAIKLFKRIYYNFPKTRVGAISAYNAACGYALSGSQDEAIDWLEYSVKAGYNDFDHLRKDTDLDGLRNEKRYKKLLTDR
jgi:tetratricopeptide (TPR) repeat protein